MSILSVLLHFFLLRKGRLTSCDFYFVLLTVMIPAAPQEKAGIEPGPCCVT
jgi:hypothetical protein